MVIEVLKPLRVHLRDRTVDLRPGQPTELNDEEAARLLAKKPDAVRRVLTPDGGCNVPMPGAHICWIRQDGSQATGKVVEVLIDPSANPPIIVVVKLNDGSEVTLNPRTVKLWVLNAPMDTTGHGGGKTHAP